MFNQNNEKYKLIHNGMKIIQDEIPVTPSKKVHFETAPSLIELMEKKDIENLRYYSPE